MTRAIKMDEITTSWRGATEALLREGRMYEYPVARMVEPREQRVNQNKGGYHPFSVHAFLLGKRLGMLTSILTEERMNVNQQSK
jgi:hypothetical protein